jgi:hypothetical protein
MTLSRSTVLALSISNTLIEAATSGGGSVFENR